MEMAIKMLLKILMQMAIGMHSTAVGWTELLALKAR
jgi:hypothetical protein